MEQSGCALPILEISSQKESPNSVISDTYKLNIQNFVSVLEKVGDYPVATYCMSGTSRIGKSYTLNFFMRKLGCAGSSRGEFSKWFEAPFEEMFGWRNGRKRETVGINLWSEPFFINHHGKKVAILFMDGQGLFDNETTFQQNAVIFSLCSLLSSVCIFNVIKKIDADTLQHLQFFSDYSRAIGSKQNYDEEKESDSSKVNGGDRDPDEIQKLVILVRDFDDINEYGYGYHDTDSAPLNIENNLRNYFHDTMLIDSNADIPAENRATIKGIRENYENIGIFLLPDPGKKFRLSPRDNVPDEDYQEYLMELVDVMTSEKHLTTKRIGGHELTANEFIPFVKHLDFICQHAKDNFPSARTIGESTMVMANTLAVSNAYKVFVNKCNEFLELSPHASDEFLEARYNIFLQQAQEAFGRMKKIGGKLVEDMCRSELAEKCQMGFASIKQMHSLKRALKATEDGYKADQEKTRTHMAQLETMINEMKKNGRDHQNLIEELRQNREIMHEREAERAHQINELKGAQRQHQEDESGGYIEIAKSIGQFLLQAAMGMVMEKVALAVNSG